MASHLLNALGAIALWTTIGCCLLIASYLLCWFLGREAQRPGMASLEAFGDIVELPAAAKCAGGKARIRSDRLAQDDVRTHREGGL